MRPWRPTNGSSPSIYDLGSLIPITGLPQSRLESAERTVVGSFDYIVVGGGTAGCVLAARLSQDPDTQVLLLEAGAAKPSAEMADPLAFFRLMGTSVDWGYETVPQRGTDDAVHPWPRGKVLGGSSGINGMMHIRGDRSAYDAWESAGAVGWNYDTLLPFLKRSERADAGDPRYRGKDGPMRVEHSSATDPLWEACFEAAVEAGYPLNDDSNGAVAEGTSWSEMNVVDGKRQSAADAYLTPVASRPNLTIVTDAHVRRLCIERTNCQGVEYSLGGQRRTASADREVVLAAGAIGTPQLLLLSGIGPGQHLRDHGIEVIADLPGVGANLQDHPKSQIAYTTTRPVNTGRYARKPHVLLRSEPSTIPDLQMIFIRFPIHPRFAPGPEDGYSVIFSLMTPASRGSIRLASPNPDRPPLIDPYYLSDPSDVTRMIVGLRVARKIGAARALGAIRDKELFPGRDTQTDLACDGYLRRSVSTYFHPVGTCKIGTNVMSVVDPQLKVHGIAHLRIVDASVMPSIVSGNTNAAVLGIAERAASLLTSERITPTLPAKTIH
jgi:choline dehydrogenase